MNKKNKTQWTSHTDEIDGGGQMILEGCLFDDFHCMYVCGWWWRLLFLMVTQQLDTIGLLLLRILVFPCVVKTDGSPRNGWRRERKIVWCSVPLYST